MDNPASGPLSFNSNLNGTYPGGGAPIPISNYYRGGSYVNTTATTPYVANAYIDRGYPQPFPTLSTNFSKLTVIQRWSSGTFVYGINISFEYVQNSTIYRYFYWSGQLVFSYADVNTPGTNPAFGPFGSTTQYQYYVQDNATGGQPYSPYSINSSFIPNGSGNQTNLPPQNKDTWYNYYGLSRALSKPAATYSVNTTVPASGEVKMSDYYLQGN